MGVVRTLAAAFVTALSVCVAPVHSAAQDAPPAPPPPQVVKSADGTASIAVPGDWKLFPAAKARPPHHIEFDAVAPGRVNIHFESLEERSRETGEAAYAARLAARWRTDRQTTAVEMLPGKLSQYVTTWKDDAGAWTSVDRVALGGRVLQIAQFTLASSSIDALKPAILKALASYVPSPQDRLPPPAGYVHRESVGIDFWHAPGVKSIDALYANVQIATTVREVSKRYSTYSGRPAVTPRVFFHADRSTCDTYSDTFLLKGFGFRASLSEATIHIFPSNLLDPPTKAALAHISAIVAFDSLFGSPRPSWFSNAAVYLASAETLAGKPHPSMPTAFQRWDRKGRLETLAALYEMDGERLSTTHQIDVMAHLLLLRDGPPQYQAALRRFLQILESTGDDAEAMKPLLELNQAKLAADARKYFDEKTKWITPK